MKNFIDTYNVSRETFDRLKAYEASLFEWQKKFNLVSNASLNDCWNRHFLDSAQLIKYIPQTARVMYDFGSGAGFPGMVLAIMLKEKTPYLKVRLIESIRKKTLYLKAVAELTHTDVEIVNDRIENLKVEKADVITSRAMTSLKELLAYTYKFCKKETVCIFPKGKKYAEEILEARRQWNFNVEIFASEQSNEGKILVITGLNKK